MTRVTVLSDVHGNAIALQAVVSQALTLGANSFWVIGDHVANGPQPVEVAKQLRALPNLRAVRGNTDRYVLTGDFEGMIPAITEPRTSRERAVLRAATAAHAWTRRRLESAGHLEWLAALPLEWRVRLPNREWTLMVHASPGRDDGRGVGQLTTATELAEQHWDTCAASLAFVGHTHEPAGHHLGEAHIVNVGSVSNPKVRRGATWTMLEATSHGYRLHHHETEWNRADLARVIAATDHPTPEWLASKLHL